MWKKIKSKPNIKKAIRFDGSEKMMGWFLKKCPAKILVVYGKNILVIPTLEGNMQAKKGDWIIKGLKGELYPCKPDIFAQTYELVI